MWRGRWWELTMRISTRSGTSSISSRMLSASFRFQYVSNSSTTARFSLVRDTPLNTLSMSLLAFSFRTLPSFPRNPKLSVLAAAVTVIWPCLVCVVDSCTCSLLTSSGPTRVRDTFLAKERAHGEARGTSWQRRVLPAPDAAHMPIVLLQQQLNCVAIAYLQCQLQFAFLNWDACLETEVSSFQIPCQDTTYSCAGLLWSNRVKCSISWLWEGSSCRQLFDFEWVRTPQERPRGTNDVSWSSTLGHKKIQWETNIIVKKRFVASKAQLIIRSF